MEKFTLNAEKKFKYVTYGLAISPLIFIITLITFYIHANVILGYTNISGINPDNLFLYYAYQTIIIVSFILSFFGFFIWLIVNMIWFLKYKPTWNLKLAIFTFSCYLAGSLLVFSKVMEFALD
ncbi:hypothetical protein HYN48_13960 [Flavobacterium magnum]|uniref:Uncharacterized protein n=1 Tax=Flavobacterium magnum TaxID=2162713 RepID=A0A2S0RHF2_9FLAO|nr:hypothetical protein [Flavobacterium magnum]AWA31104.1 hypothetical protein HYN48_13960 [Flavobacterium magnum]